MLDRMLISDWISLITALGVIVAMIVGVANMIRTGRKDAGADIGAITEMRTDVKHIREKVDRLENIPERLSAVDEATKSAHKRLDGHESRLQKLEVK